MERCRVQICGVTIFEQIDRVVPKQNQSDFLNELSRKAIDHLLSAVFSKFEVSSAVAAPTGVQQMPPKVDSQPPSSSSSNLQSLSLQHEALFRKLKLNLSTTAPQMNPIQRIGIACAKAKCIPQVSFSSCPSSCCTLKVDEVLVAQGWGTNKKIAKNDAFTRFVAFLELPYFQVAADPQNGGQLTFFASINPIGSDAAQETPGDSVNASFDGSGAEELRSMVLFEFVGRASDVTPTNILNTSAQFNHFDVEYVNLPADLSTATGDCRYRTAVYVQGVKVSEGGGFRKEEAKRNAAQQALDKLRRTQYTILVKSSIDKSQDAVSVNGAASSSGRPPATVALPDTNVGRKMLEKMGWTGGGIGLYEQGIKEPISLQETWQRNGIGSSVGGNFCRVINALLSDYAHSDRQDDLVFSVELSREQRGYIHRAARRFQLKSASYGTGESRQLTLQKPRTPHQLLAYLQMVGGETGKYRLIPPSSFSSQQC
ncbi:unnamed protein product [Soboliphyme baturini]|uniref:NF-kappa-B-repressing factor n=1 Tax=Soboliphyme baturini TaxID=241478 RepID=A0A183IYD4_9BILA|nr:unnamed protein product [Soboliphyme baturini]